MAIQIHVGEDLGIANCEHLVEGETAGEVVDEVIKHLRKEHDIDLPEKDDILENSLDRSLYSEKTRILTEILQERLRISGVDIPRGDQPSPPKVPS